MAIYGWIYANAKRNDNLDYCSRGGHRELKEWGLTKNMDSLLPKIASRLLSPNYRNNNRQKEPCWFSGYLDKEKYMVAVGGTQEDLLGMAIEDGSFRIQLCVFAYVFTEQDISLYQCDSAMFEPLKEKLKEIQCTTKEEEKEYVSCLIKKDLSKYKISQNEVIDKRRKISTEIWKKKNSFNILESTMEIDNAVWLESLERPVAISVPTIEDAKRFLNLFPKENAITTVIDGSTQQYEQKQMNKSLDFSMSEVKKTMEMEKEYKLAEVEPNKQTALRTIEHKNGYSVPVVVFFTVIVIIFSMFWEEISFLLAIFLLL